MTRVICKTCRGVGIQVRLVDSPWVRAQILRPGSGGRRGAVTGFSTASARRFRKLLFDLEGSGDCFSITLTVRDVASPDQWRSNVLTWSKRLVRSGVSGFWRVELQRRGTPHLHCLLWGDADAVRTAWLEVWRVSRDPAHVRHAVRVDCFGGSAWLGYMASHAIKHKRDQLGWQGRQWGVINRRNLHRREMDVQVLDLDLYQSAIERFNARLVFLKLWSGLPWLSPFVRFCGDDVIQEFRRQLDESNHTAESRA